MALALRYVSGAGWRNFQLRMKTPEFSCISGIDAKGKSTQTRFAGIPPGCPNARKSGQEWEMDHMKKYQLLGATALAMFAVTPAFAQSAADDDNYGEILVTAQRQSESLQDVPISVSAFGAEQLESQQIENALDLQLSLPNVTFTKTNFTDSSFTIRGVGDLCVGTSCDAATGIHVNDMPTITRLFETEYFDLERLEVLRGPQGTLYGRNATSGVVNFITKRPDLNKMGASGEIEYGNYKSIKAKATLNVPIGETLGLRVAGFYLNRDGYTKDLANNSRIDGRNMYALRGSLRWQPSDATTVELIGYYFHEKDDRNRVGKQLCHRDTSGVLGCAPDRVGYEIANGHATLGGILTNQEVIGAALGWTSRAGADIYAGQVNPADMRTVNSGYKPYYFVEDKQLQLIINQDLGDTMHLQMTGGYTSTYNDTRTDYFMAAGRNISTLSGIPTFKAVFPTAAGKLFNSAGQICASNGTDTYAGVYGGLAAACANSPVSADRSSDKARSYSFEAHLDSDFDGPFNFLIGGIYYDLKADSDYFVESSGLDYAAVVLAGATGGQAGYVGPSMYNSETDPYTLKSYGLFGEAYWEPSDKFKITFGARYSNDKKQVFDRQFLFNFFTPFGTSPLTAAGFAGYDADVNKAGAQSFRNLGANFDEVTGRLVFDWKPTEDNLIYLSLSRGYKSGGINPPFDNTLFTAPATFNPEIIQALEIGTKNKFADGKVILNASAFYYDYKDLQLSRIINRTSFNDNTNAEIYGLEVEAVLRPDPAWTFNLSASYLHTKIKNFSLVDTRDPSNGRSDVVIIKDAASAANCVVQPTGAITGQQLMTAIGQGGALVPVTGTNTVGALSSCSAILGAIATPPAALAAAFGVAPGNPLPFAFARNLAGAPLALPSGVAADLSGNKLPQAPSWKFSAGAQYDHEFGNGMSLVTRLDLTYTGEYFSRSFNKPIDKIKGYEIVNASMTLNGPDKKWYARAFIQNLTANDAITGQYVTDPSSGLFTNAFVMEPRRYGLAVGFNF
jgi:outer membrane receptor protein involved in Fe transport